MASHAPPASDAPALSREDRSWGVLAHLSAIIAAVLSAGWLSLIGPLVVYLMKKNQPAVERARRVPSISIWPSGSFI